MTCGHIHKANPKEWEEGQKFVSGREKRFARDFVDLVKSFSDQISWAERQSIRKPAFDFFVWMDSFDWVTEFEEPLHKIFTAMVTPVIIQSQKDTIKSLGFGLKKAGVYKEAWRPEMADAPVGVKLALDWVDSEGSRLIVGVGDNSRKAINGIVRETIWEGKDPRKIFKEIKKSVGLFPKWAKAVENYELRLRGDGWSVKDAQIKAAKYHDHLVGVRAETIARTEIIRARNVGQMQAWNVTQQQGLLDQRYTKRRWVSAVRSPRTCKICISLDLTSKKKPIPMNGSYTITKPKNLTIKMPPAHPQCRCSQALVFELPGKKPVTAGPGLPGTIPPRMVPLSQMTPSALHAATVGAAAAMAVGPMTTEELSAGLVDSFWGTEEEF